jgi:hypothetical protein
MAADLFVVPTVTFRLLFALVILAHDRRQIVHVAVTEHPTAAWTAQQLRNAFPENEAPRYLLHARDSVFAHVATTLEGMNIQEVRTAPRSPWQNAYAERVIGSIRRECLDHVIVVNTKGLHGVLTNYLAYYLRSRTHLALGKDTPVTLRSHRCRRGALSPQQKSAVYIIATIASPHSCRTTLPSYWPSPSHLCVEHFCVAVRCCGCSLRERIVGVHSGETLGLWIRPDQRANRLLDSNT